jgi:hypothetical protein
MTQNGINLMSAFESRDLGRLSAVLHPSVIWRGVDVNPEPIEHIIEDGEDHDRGPAMCTDREQVLGVFAEFLEAGGAADPVLLAEAGDTFVVDPRTNPSLDYPLHQSFTFRGDLVVLIQDYPDRASAMKDIRLE